ncbi:unnamed protein product [Oncorhynchus mykiss]|uniref:D-3-phosphoglycerate dehydrogenase ASB domain-containing protein n=1 Tax=Oncorhynchus mykiss TaxID=8022 RepID=A0A060VS61_ONCMY|nr:unnamed protein product [Oncorhynchus mykiss]
MSHMQLTKIYMKCLLYPKLQPTHWSITAKEPPKNRALVNHPNVISCPHLGASTKEAQARCGQDIALQIVDMVMGKSLVGAVNAQVLASTFTPESHQWIKLGESIGAALKSCTTSKQPFSQVQIITQGDCLKDSSAYMTSAVMVGLLRDGSQSCPNLVNSLTLAKESGITVTRNHSEGLTQGACEVEISVNGSSYRATGSVQGGVPVLLELNSSVFRQPVSLTGNLLFFKAVASPPLLPSVTGLLATAGVEMESFSAPAARSGDQWYCVGLSSLLGDLGALKPFVKAAAQVSV